MFLSIIVHKVVGFCFGFGRFLSFSKEELEKTLKKYFFLLEREFLIILTRELVDTEITGKVLVIKARDAFSIESYIEETAAGER